jgi:hypothetical protein
MSFLRRIPSIPKWALASLPAVILAAMLAGGALTNRGGQQQAGAAAALGGSWQAIQDNILQRAAISLADDFRSGLGDWEGQGDWAKFWSYDNAGFVRTGALALYTPSRNMTDYRMEFLGQIERKSLSWVVRAADFKNYYIVRLVTTRGGPLPTVAIVRHAVVNGKEERPVQRPLPMSVQSDTLYRVRMDVRGQNYTLAVQGQVVDFWTEDRLKRGGIGFLSSKGEQARLRWVGVWHQYDMLGRLCAYLAPYSMHLTGRSVTQ